MNNNNLQQKKYILDGLGCANCAARMEQKIQQLPAVESAVLTFATKQLMVSAPDPDALEKEIQNICQSIEGGVRLVEKPEREKTYSNRKKPPGLPSVHKAELITLVIGAILFACGLLWEYLASASGFAANHGNIVTGAGPFVIFITAYLLLGHKVLLTAIHNIPRGQIFDENFLMSIATISAFSIGEFAEGVGVMLFYRIGELFEHIAVERSRSQIMEVVDMRPETVNLVVDGLDEHEEHCACGHEHHHHDKHFIPDNSIRIIPAEDAKPGDILLVRPGDRIPLDGIVADGQSRIDTSPVTGEPVPVSAGPGTSVISGCLNQQGVLKIRVTHPLSESMVTKILDSVENAAAGKPKIDKFITRFARIYTPVVVALAILTAIIPSLITGEWAAWIRTAITFLVISCPCALVISVPLAFFSGIGAASRLGILFKSGLAMEAIKNIKCIVMDKTGTITKGVFAVDHISPFGDLSEDELLTLASSCETASSHPVAVSITEAARARGLYIAKTSSLEELSGMGIRATFEEGHDDRNPHTICSVLCGNRKLMDKYGVQLPKLPKLSGSSGTEVLVAVNGIAAGSIMISDQLKEDSIEAVHELKTMGLVPAMLTGDNMESAAAVAAASGISKIRAGLLPEDKVAALRELRDELGAVMFVGDGINDAPVLAGADVGASMGSGADAAIEAADVVFMNSSLSAIPQSIAIARRVRRIAIQNIAFALGIKLLVILFGLAGFANIWAAVFADTGVAMLCILNSLRLLVTETVAS